MNEEISKKAAETAIAIVQRLLRLERIEVWDHYQQAWVVAGSVGNHRAADGNVRYRLSIPAMKEAYFNVYPDGAYAGPYSTEAEAASAKGNDGETVLYVRGS